MTVRITVATALMCLALVGTGAGAASATAQPEAAKPTVAGVTGVRAAGNGGADCGYEALCLYTGANYTGTRFALYACANYALSNWTATGSYYNNQTSDTEAFFTNSYGHPVRESFAPDWDSHFAYAPIWHVKNC